MKVLAYTAVGRGHLYPMMPLLLELRARGHVVHVRTIASEVHTLASFGLDASALDPRIESVPSDDASATNPVQAFAHGMEMFARRAVFEAPDLDAAVAAYSPDLLVVDANAWGAMAGAEACRLPWACFSASPIPIRSPGLPPFGPGLAPARGISGRARDVLVGAALDALARRIAGPRINATRTSVGLPALTDPDDFYRRPPVLLVATAEPFEYPHPDVPNLVYLGACEWDPPTAQPPWLGAIDRPIVLVTTSSDPQRDEVLVRHLLAAMAGTGLHVVATMPAGVPSDLVVPPDATVVRFAPHGSILDRASVAVTHGGMGATQKALARGVPTVAVPFGRDQLEVARRLELARAGIRLPSRIARHPRRGPRALRAAVRAAGSMTAGARAVADGYLATGGASTGADVIEAAARR
ncbi:glycosyltransferase [Tsukamurella sp. 8F]|uniref:glycosyltransferase n=1 Tax=unclassified Tsukamurella TaxID=2633480 RepID=UPI0023B89F22|nr:MULTISPECIES: glycosyltransferase [unclassified Tsukamurella]MDF0529341.1 glycosyltransferase [Tsukamurella sp. 8J]MDF0587152.1 glycosyltransferase [Tsukamurella sp. 8F]